MKRLFLDTANKYLYVAVMDDEKIILSHTQPGNNNHSETLISVISDCFHKASLKPDDIDEVYVGKGPGSYTGVRVACTVAKTFAYSKKIKLFSFSSLDLLYTTHLEDGQTLVKMDARRGFSYAKVFEKKQNIQVTLPETYIETLELSLKYTKAFVITADSFEYHPELILKYGLYLEEDVFQFEPTYLRSGV